MNKYLSYFNQKTHHAFTLLEMLFAVIIFSFALVSLIGITGKGVVATITAKNQLTAQYLAEELIEVARNVRDSNYVEGTAAWDTGIVECTASEPCGVDYSGKPVLMEGRETLFENEGVFGSADIGGNKSIFTRELYFKPIGADKQGELVSTVYWQEKGVERKFELKTYIADWQTASSTTP
jgi:prepilin-type N-terminal cleavage/methylation domain-containing protein